MQPVRRLLEHLARSSSSPAPKCPSAATTRPPGSRPFQCLHPRQLRFRLLFRHLFHGRPLHRHVPVRPITRRPARTAASPRSAMPCPQSMGRTCSDLGDDAMKRLFALWIGRRHAAAESPDLSCPRLWTAASGRHRWHHVEFVWRDQVILKNRAGEPIRILPRDRLSAADQAPAGRGVRAAGRPPPASNGFATASAPDTVNPPGVSPAPAQGLVTGGWCTEILSARKRPSAHRWTRNPSRT